MSLTIKTPISGTTLCTTTKTTTPTTTHIPLHRSNHHSTTTTLYLSRNTSSSHIVTATGKFTPRTSKFDSKNRRAGGSTTTKEEVTKDSNKFVDDNNNSYYNNVKSEYVDDGFVIPELPGDKPDFWEGEQWDGVGFFVQYMWAFGVVFALVACGIAVATYNEGASDFKETPAYKESIQSQDLLEGPEASDSDVFESNPTEEAPALE